MKTDKEPFCSIQVLENLKIEGFYEFRSRFKKGNIKIKHWKILLWVNKYTGCHRKSVIYSGDGSTMKNILYEYGQRLEYYFI